MCGSRGRQEGLERSAAVDERVVGHYRFGRYAAEVGEGAQARSSVRSWCRRRRGVQLDVGDAAVVIDDAVEVVEAEPALRSSLPVAGDAVAGLLKRPSFLTSMCSSAPGRDHS